MENKMALNNQLCFSIYNANRLFGRFYQQILAPYQLTYTQYLVLLALWENDQRTLHDLGKELHLASNTLTSLLKRMETAGWLVRLRPEKDRRQLIIQLTEKGRTAQDQIERDLSQCVSENNLDSASYQELLADNEKLIATLRGIVDK